MHCAVQPNCTIYINKILFLSYNEKYLILVSQCLQYSYIMSRKLYMYKTIN